MKSETFPGNHEDIRAFLDYVKALVGTSRGSRVRVQLHGGDRRKCSPSDYPGETTTDANLGTVCPEHIQE